MTCSCVAPLRPVTSHLPPGSTSATVVALLTILTACGTGPETGRSPSRNPDSSIEVDAGDICPSFDSEYRDAHKGCDVDADCEPALVRVSCTGTNKLFGVASDLREDFDRCAPAADNYKRCKGGPSPTRAEDGRPTTKPDGSDAVVRCVAGKCQSRIEDRPCGGKVCHAGELCVASQNSEGVVESVCTSNPCTSVLDCKCAEPVCKLRTDRVRICAIDQISESDVFCKAEQR